MEKYKLKSTPLEKKVVKGYEHIEKKVVTYYKKIEKLFISTFLEKIEGDKNDDIQNDWQYF